MNFPFFYHLVIFLTAVLASNTTKPSVAIEILETGQSEVLKSVQTTGIVETRFQRIAIVNLVEFACTLGVLFFHSSPHVLMFISLLGIGLNAYLYPVLHRHSGVGPGYFYSSCLSIFAFLYFTAQSIYEPTTSTSEVPWTATSMCWQLGQDDPVLLFVIFIQLLRSHATSLLAYHTRENSVELTERCSTVVGTSISDDQLVPKK